MHVHLLFVIYTLIFVNSTVASTQTLATTSLAHRHFLVITASYWRGLFIKGNGMARMKPCHLYHLWWLTDSTDSLLRHITIYVGRVGSIFDIFPYIIQLNLMSTFGRHLKLLFVLVCIALRFSADLILLVDVFVSQIWLVFLWSRNIFDEDRVPDSFADDVTQDIHSISSLLKMYFRELPNPLLTYHLYNKFVVSYPYLINTNTLL